MLLPDVNVLVAAHREDHPQHDLAAPWLEDALNGAEPVTVPDLVLTGFVRVVTNRRIFDVPTPLDDAFGFLRAVGRSPASVPTPRSGRELELFESVCRDAGAAGALVPDAYLAALAIGLGARLVTFDRDLRRFDRLQLIELRN